MEFAEFQQNIERFTGAGIKVLGISLDTVESHAKFAAENSPDVTLLSDADASIAKAYDVFFGVGSNGVAKRGYFLVDGERVIQFKHLDAMNVMENQTATLLDAVAKLSE